MSKAFKKKKQEQSIDTLSDNLSFLLGSQLLQNNNQIKVKLERSFILKSAMFWDSKSRVERIKSLVLSNLNLQQFDDVEDFKIEELSSIELLSLSKNHLIHLQPISILDTLLTLNINHNKVYNLSPLEQLKNLQEFYASNNQISNIDPLKNLKNIRVLNLYKNKIINFELTYNTLAQISKIDDLDVEQNPFYSEQVRTELINLPITRLNDKRITKAEKENNTSKNSSIVNMASSCFITPLNLSVMRDTKSSFFNPSVNSIKRNKIKELKEKLENLEDQYSKIDDEFEQEIVKNVQLKSQLCKLSQQMKKNKEKKQENQYKSQEIKLLKRKAKDLKQNLFTKDKKGELLRALFQLETQSLPKKTQKKQQKKEVIWTRKFDSDEVIIIQDDNKYLQQDSELAALLESNSSALEQLRRQLKSFY